MNAQYRLRHDKRAMRYEIVATDLPGVSGPIVVAVLDYDGLPELECALGETAKMMIAAPDLLEACTNLISVVEQLIPEPSARGVADVVLFQARAAIDKATKGGA